MRYLEEFHAMMSSLNASERNEVRELIIKYHGLDSSLLKKFDTYMRVIGELPETADSTGSTAGGQKTSRT